MHRQKTSFIQYNIYVCTHAQIKVQLQLQICDKNACTTSYQLFALPYTYQQKKFSYNNKS